MRALRRLGLCFLLLLLAALARGAELSAPTPAGPEARLSATRAEIVLNGLWRWLPAAERSERAPANEADWGLIWVPGAWGNNLWGSYSNVGTGHPRVPGVHKAGSGPEWKAWGDALRRGWYEREFTVPEGWAGREIVLGFDRLATDAEVWIDGQEAGRVDWPQGELVITRHATPGKSHRVRVLVSAVLTATEAIDYMGVGQNTSTRARMDLRGISGDVVLSSRPAGARVTDVFAKTSVREGRLTLDLEFAGVAPSTVLAVDARATAEDGTVKTFAATATTAAPDGQAAPESGAVLRGLGWDWPDARRWDLDDPHLYRLDVAVRVPGAAQPLDVFPVTVGFREFWTEGRDFYLNGTKIRLRPALLGDDGASRQSVDAVRAELRRWKNAGRNVVEIWPAPKNRGGRVPDSFVADLADREGMLLIAPALRINEYAMGAGYRSIWDKPEGRALWEPLYRADWRKLRNHPSIVMAGLSGNLGGHQHDQDPRWLGRRGLPRPDATSANTQKAMREADAVVAAFDPTRLRFHHQGGPFGDVFTINHYLNLIPLQERAEWLSEWARTGDMPYLGVEFGTPFNATMLRGRNGFGPSITTEPFLAEYAAIYLGPQAYELQGEDYLRAVRSRFERIDAEGVARWASWQTASELNRSPAFQKLTELFVTRTWRAWRVDGVSGGMIPWQNGYGLGVRETGDIAQVWTPGRRGWFLPVLSAAALAESFDDAAVFRKNPAGVALEKVNGPVLAWIAGPAGRVHAPEPRVAAGGEFTRQIALLNDTRTPRSYSARWRVEPATGGAPLDRGESSGELAVAQTLLIPVAFKAPAEIPAGEKRDLALVLEAEIGGIAQTDRTVFRVFGPDRTAAAPSIALHDPAGRTARMLRALGVEFSVLDRGTRPPAGALLVLGRESLSSGVAPPAWLEAFVAEGGRALLMAQAPSWITRNLGLRVAPVPARHLWTVPTAELAGEFDADDLREWNGAGTLVEARPDHASTTAQMPTHGWRWGNTASVSSAMIEKPHRSGWTPLLEGEWDLAYSPLLELSHGRGRLTWCTLDLEDQAAVDPAAARLARRVLELAARPASGSVRLAEIAYAGSEAGAEALRLTGVNFRSVKTIDPRAPLVVVDAATSLSDEQLEAYARQGGTVVMLAQPGGETSPRLGVTLRLEKRFAGGVAPEANLLTRGLSASDLRLRSPQDMRLLSGGATTYAGGLLGARAVGKGRIVFVQFDPAGFDLQRRPFYKHTQWRLTRAFSQVLANLGASFAADRALFEPQILRVELAGEWAVRFTRELSLAPWDKPHADPGISPAAKALLQEKADTSGWERFALPANHPRFSEISGEAVWRREIALPASWAGESAILHIPALKSFDTVTINGVEVGSTTKDTDPKNPNPWNTPRAYRIPPGLLRAGMNVVAIRQFCPDKDGGLHGRADRFYLQLLVPENRTLRFYADNWNDDFKYGDDPYRYYRW